MHIRPKERVLESWFVAANGLRVHLPADGPEDGLLAAVFLDWLGDAA